MRFQYQFDFDGTLVILVNSICNVNNCNEVLNAKFMFAQQCRLDLFSLKKPIVDLTSGSSRSQEHQTGVALHS